jgi:hypothetical protein
MERCLREIAAIEAELLAGNPDVQGLCLALSDWHAELRILRGGNRDAADSVQTIAANGGGRPRAPAA